MIDYTKLRKKLIPEPDGEPNLILRTATVNAVNSNGTVDLTMSSGVVLTNIPRLAGSYTPVGAVVQVISLRGSLLVIGGTASTSYPGGTFQLPLIKTGSISTGPSASASFLTSAIPYGVTFPGVPNVHVNLAAAGGANAGWVGRAFSINTTDFRMAGYGTSSTFTETFQWTAIYAP